ncbi:right-handed parallel beta-helix repeat-containing protein [Tsuneonella sp. YG55]|uniref:Right-handed parallel beta-helix repeat-containing protein n=1 Tax=Tsuneonella litorea TaxID=2976475 RepID=A0A9X2W1K0_9SPHN|nr:parallel beta-helix domain-containing protein [Tsuneonella litorea]MCT2558549.1 right-handed parallel beta-helix repeat-containing protein [Tsuneonella litorea]
MRMTLIAPLALAAVASPALAATHDVAAGEGAQTRLQEALILAEPGDEIVLGAGRFALDDGLSLDVDGVTVRGAGMDVTVLDFSGQKGAGEGLLVTSDKVTLRDFAIENPKGDGIKSKGADDIVYHRVRVTWTGGPLSTNGAYGIYPVESTNVLIDGVQVSGASDAGIYVGQSRKITVRNSLAQANVAGIEIENSRDALVTMNMVTRNTGGILVFDLPDLPVMGGGNVLVQHNLVVDNDTANFAPPGNIVAGVRRGTGVMVMANDAVTVENNMITGNPTTAVMVVAYPRQYEDSRYNPYPRKVAIGHNMASGNGTDPQIGGGEQLVAMFGGALPAVMWDGLGENALTVDPAMSGWTLALTKQGQGPDDARPAPAKFAPFADAVDRAAVGASAELDARVG